MLKNLIISVFFVTVAVEINRFCFHELRNDSNRVVGRSLSRSF